MSGDDINTYRFPKTLNNQGRWFGLTPDELIPIVLSACWFFWQGKQIAGIIVAALVYMAIRKIKKGRAVSGCAIWATGICQPSCCVTFIKKCRHRVFGNG